MTGEGTRKILSMTVEYGDRANDETGKEEHYIKNGEEG